MKVQEKKFNKFHVLIVVAMIGLALGLKLYGYYWPKAVIDLNGKELKVLVADTPAHLFKGWSGKKDMGKYDGMLFVFDETSQHTMVMRNMNFSLDIIWLKGFEIVDMAPERLPEKGVPEAQLTPYLARDVSNMVLELPAGYIRQNGVKIGDRINVVSN